MCNEVFFTAKPQLPKTKALLTKCVDLTHQLDPTRPAAIGGSQRGGVDHLGDIAGYNGDGAKLFINPGIPNAVTEYGSV
jgi:beta-galactosidase